MSDAVAAEEGYPAMLSALIDGAVWWCHLFTNDVTPSKAMKRADFVEVVMVDYAALPLDRFSPPTLRGGVAFAVADPPIFTYPGGPEPLPVRGYYVTAGKLGPVVWAWRFPGAGFQFDPDNAVLAVNVRLTWPIICP